MKSTGPIVLSLVCLVVTKPLGAGVNRWSSGGPYGGVRSALVADPVDGQIIYALTGAGVFKSTDGGSTFGPMNTGLNVPGTNFVPGVGALAVDPRRPSTIYSSAGGRLFKSGDSSSIWCPVDLQASSGGVSISGLVPDPNTADMMYAVGDSGLFRTTDAGATWNQLFGGTAYSVAIHPQNPSILLVGSVGFYRSVDGGRSWTQPGTGLVGCCYSSVVFDPVSPSNAWTTSQHGVFKSIDAGVSWTASGLPFGARNLRLDPSSPAALFAVATQFLGAAGYQDAVVRSLDGGATWNPINAGLPTEGGLNVPIYSLALGPGSPAKLLVSTAGGLFKSTDRGGNWQALGGTPAGASVSGVLTSRSVPGPVYAAVSGHLFRSPDGGRSWTEGGGISNINLLAVDPMTSSTLYAATSSGLMKSLDSGISWSSSGCCTPAHETWKALAVSPSDPSTIYVAGSGGGIFKSMNAGLSWAQEAGSFAVGTLQSLAVDPANSAVLYAGSGSYGVYKSSDGGASWKKTSVGLPEQPFITSLAVDPRTTSTIYAADSLYYGLFKSLDGGASWTAINKGIGSARISGIAIDPVRPSSVYAGTQDAGVFRSSDGGLSWRPMLTGLTAPSVTGLAIDSTGTALHAGTFGSGVFDFQIDASAGFGQLLPIVLDVNNGSAHFTSDLTLTNASADRVPVTLTYKAALGSKEGSGSVTDELGPGEQRRIPDGLSYLRGMGLPIPAAAVQPSQGGTLLLSYAGSGADPRRVACIARTAAGTGAPQPAGRAGLAYGGPLLIEEAPWLAVYGLRSTASDRSNLAVANVSADPVTFRVTLFSGTGDGRSVVFRSGQTLPPYGWIQFNSPELLEQTGIANGWAVVERICSAGALTAYGVVNDRSTNDGSFLAPVAAGNPARRLTVPALVETARFRSEVVLTNPTAEDIGLEMSYVESLSPGKGAGGTVTLTLEKGRQLIIPEAIEYLRRLGARIGARDEASYAGSLRITATPGSSSGFAAGARTSALSSAPEGGQFGLFTPGIFEGQAAQTAAFLFGLAADGDNRSNAAVANTGADADGSITLRLQVHDGDAGGMSRGEPIGITLDPGGWKQMDGILRAVGVSNGWVEITRTSGSAPWIAYGVINDGGNPGERTGDGAYVPMTK